MKIIGMHLIQLLMRNLKSIIIACFIAGLMMVSCGTSRHYECNHFIPVYFSLSDFHLLDVIEDQNVLRIATYSSGALYTFLDKGDDGKYYESLCARYNDYIKTDVYVIDGVDIDGPSYSDVNPVSINAVALTDFDETHKAGCSLNDIARLMSVSPYKYINSRREYDYSEDENLSQSFRSIFAKYYQNPSNYTCDPHYYYPVDKLLSDITSEDLILLGLGYGGERFYIKFEADPTAHCEVRIDIKTEDSRSFSLQATI